MTTDLRLALDPDAFARAAGLDGELDDWQRAVLDAGETEAAAVLLAAGGQVDGRRAAGGAHGGARAGQPGAVRQPEHAAVERAVPAGDRLLPRPDGAAEPAGGEAGERAAARAENGAGWCLCPAARGRRVASARRASSSWTRRARIEDELITSLAPMQATSLAGRRRFVAMSTPYGRRGWFFDRWQSADPGWFKVTVPAGGCPRISAEFLAEQERELGPLLVPAGVHVRVRGQRRDDLLDGAGGGGVRPGDPAVVRGDECSSVTSATSTRSTTRSAATSARRRTRRRW